MASRPADLLLETAYTATGLDYLNDAYDVRLKEWRLRRRLGQPGFEFQRGDIAQLPELSELWANRPAFDAVLKRVARAGVPQPVENAWIYHETNETGPRNLLQLCRRLGVRKCVLASSSSLSG